MDAAAPQLQLQPSRPKKRTGTSKYDFIKVCATCVCLTYFEMVLPISWWWPCFGMLSQPPAAGPAG